MYHTFPSTVAEPVKASSGNNAVSSKVSEPVEDTAVLYTNVHQSFPSAVAERVEVGPGNNAVSSKVSELVEDTPK